MYASLALTAAITEISQIVFN